MTLRYLVGADNQLPPSSRLVLEGSTQKNLPRCEFYEFSLDKLARVAPQCIGFGFNDAYKAGSDDEIGFVLSTFRFVI